VEVKGIEQVNTFKYLPCQIPFMINGDMEDKIDSFHYFVVPPP
jgi:hypothetical protein